MAVFLPRILQKFIDAFFSRMNFYVVAYDTINHVEKWVLRGKKYVAAKGKKYLHFYRACVYMYSECVSLCSLARCTEYLKFCGIHKLVWKPLSPCCTIFLYSSYKNLHRRAHLIKLPVSTFLYSIIFFSTFSPSALRWTTGSTWNFLHSWGGYGKRGKLRVTKNGRRPVARNGRYVSIFDHSLCELNWLPTSQVLVCYAGTSVERHCLVGMGTRESKLVLVDCCCGVLDIVELDHRYRKVSTKVTHYAYYFVSLSAKNLKRGIIWYESL